MLNSLKNSWLESVDKVNIKVFLDAKVNEYNRPEFIENDPICIPHKFTLKQDQEIMGFFSAILAWGKRKTIINKCIELSDRMDGAPYDFILNHKDEDLKCLLGFKHRTFNDTDLLYFISFFKEHYSYSQTFETAFKLSLGIEDMLNNFREYFFSLPDSPLRTRKHITSPLKKSTCKRLNMFLRWMVRKDDKGVDLGIWNTISQSALMCPLDLHVDRVARRLNLINRSQTDWRTVIELTNRLKEYDPDDPAKYDFALFGLGIEERF